MWNRKIWFTFTLFCSAIFCSVPAFALDLDLNYGYKTENKEEFVITGKSNVNFNGQIPDYLLNIYDVTPQSAYNSDYGSNVVVPNAPVHNNTTYAPANAPINSSTYVQSPSGLITGTTEGGGYSENYTADISTGGYVKNNNTNTNNKIPDYSYSDWEDEHGQYPLTSVEKVRNDDGSIGVLRIPEIDLKVTAYDGDTYAAMKKGVGHISSTSVWNGNIGLVGHNRGSNDYFGDLKKLEEGDKITYETNLGKRTYYVTYVGRISDTDWSKLQYTSDNRITLITCVENDGDKRLCVQAREKE